MSHPERRYALREARSPKPTNGKMCMSMDTWPSDLSPDALAHWLHQHTEGTLLSPLRIRLVEVSTGRAVAELPLPPGVCLRNGLVHTGAMLSLADTAATFAAMAASSG